MKTPDISRRTTGSTIIVALMTVGILVTLAATVLFHVSGKYRALSQATSWRKALVAAESGIDRGMLALNDMVNDPSNAWTGWSTTNPYTGATLPDGGKCLTSAALVHGGEGGNSTYFYVVVDSPASLAKNGKTKQYYRIRATGYEDVAGGALAGDSKLDTVLRKLSLKRDRKSGQTFATPRASRTIEVVAAPMTVFEVPNVAQIKWDFDKQKTSVRSFDSSNPTYSTNGKWDPTKQIPNGGILMATNQWHKDGEKKNKFEKVDIEGATIMGDFAAYVGPVKNGENVQGSVVFGEATELAKVLPPPSLLPVEKRWTLPSDTSITKIEDKPTAAQDAAYKAWRDNASSYMQSVTDSKGIVLRGNANENTPTTLKLTKVKIEKNNEGLVLANPPGVSESWIEIWVTDELKIKDQGVLAIEQGVHATIHFEKKFKVKDKKTNGGVFVESGYAGDFLVYGIEQDESKKETDDDFSPVKTSGKVKIEDAGFIGSIYAPDYDMELKTKDKDKGNNYILGSVTGRKIKLKGETDFVYDQALKQAGVLISRYTPVSWFEDSE